MVYSTGKDYQQEPFEFLGSLPRQTSSLARIVINDEGKKEAISVGRALEGREPSATDLAFGVGDELVAETADG
jgi:hypothetical protein